MEGLFWKSINHIIFFGCIFATIGLSVYSISRFCQNEDITLVQSSTYHSSEERIYPSISLCLLPPFIGNEFDKFEDYTINMTSYIQFWMKKVRGQCWDNMFHQLPLRLYLIQEDGPTMSDIRQAPYLPLRIISTFSRTVPPMQAHILACKSYTALCH